MRKRSIETEPVKPPIVAELDKLSLIILDLVDTEPKLKDGFATLREARAIILEPYNRDLKIYQETKDRKKRKPAAAKKPVNKELGVVGGI